MSGSGFTVAQMKALRERDGNRSAWTGQESETLVPQHRANRGMGGRRSLNRLSNAVLIESDINGAIESDPAMQAEAVRRGIKIGGHVDPSTVPVEHAVHGLVLLDDAGAVTSVGEAAPWP
jgi:hypothetical protein